MSKLKGKSKIKEDSRLIEARGFRFGRPKFGICSMQNGTGYGLCQSRVQTFKNERYLVSDTGGFENPK